MSANDNEITCPATTLAEFDVWSEYVFRMRDTKKIPTFLVSQHLMNNLHNRRFLFGQFYTRLK